jgi:plasmid stability protein
LCDVAEGCIKKIDEHITHFKKIIPVLVFQPPANLALRGMQCNWQGEALLSNDIKRYAPLPLVLPLTWIHYRSKLDPYPMRRRNMPVNLSIKNVPDEIAEELREKAARNHRSLQGELMAIIEEAAGKKSPLNPSDFLAGVRALGLRTPSEARSMVREDRDAP